MRSALLAIAACANSPSPLDRAPQPPEVDVGTAWSTIARRAGPLDAASDQLDAFLATKNPDALEAWARAGGRWLRVPALRPISVMDDTVAYAGTATELVTANPGDDAFVEASLYLAQRMRRDGNDLLTAVSSIAIVRGVMRARPHAPAFAARYAPTDEEAIRAFEAEAMAVSRMVAWSTSPDDAGRVRAAAAARRAIDDSAAHAAAIGRSARAVDVHGDRADRPRGVRQASHRARRHAPRERRERREGAAALRGQAVRRRRRLCGLAKS